jgi:hypothetical protein
MVVGPGSFAVPPSLADQMGQALAAEASAGVLIL